MMTISPDKRIAFGLVTITVAVLIFAQLFGLLPDERNTKLESRKVIIESLALQVARYAGTNQLINIKSILSALKERNPDVLSTAIRSSNGFIMVEVGPHRSEERRVGKEGAPMRRSRWSQYH